MKDKLSVRKLKRSWRAEEELVVSSSVPVSVRSVYLGVDWTVVVADCVDPEQKKGLSYPARLTAWLLDKPIVGLRKNWGGREGSSPPVPPHEILQLPELVLQLHLSPGQSLHYGGIVGPHMGDGTGVQIVGA